MIEQNRQITIEDYLRKPKLPEDIGPLVRKNIEERSEEIEEVLQIVSFTYCLTPEDLIGPSRKKDIATAKHMAGYLLYSQVGLSFKAAALSLGKNDHTTILNSIHRVNHLLETSPDFKEKMDLASKSFISFKESKASFG